MHFALTDEQAMIAESAREYFRDNATSERTRRAMAGDGVDRMLWNGFAKELGLAGLVIPETHGGADLGMVELATIAEAAGAHVAALPLLGLVMAACAIKAGGSEAQQAEWLPKLAAGDVLAAVDASCHLRPAGDRLSGTVDFVPHGGTAELFLLGSELGAWLVPLHSPGLAVERLTTMDQTRPLARLRLDHVAGDPLPDPRGAIEAARTAGWICLAAEALGGAQAALDRTVAYSRERVQFGRPIGSFQAYKHRLADMMIEIEQARSAVYWAACAVEEGSPEVPLALHGAKSFAADTFFKCAADMIQLHGGIGFTWEHDAHLFFKRARSIQTMLGDGAWHREQVAQTIGLGAAA